jgi:hypothetical protein
MQHMPQLDGAMPMGCLHYQLTAAGPETRLAGQLLHCPVFSSGVKSVDGFTILTTPAGSLPQLHNLDIAL